MSGEQDTPYEPPKDLKSRLANSYNSIAPEYNAWTVKHSTGPRMTWLGKLFCQLPKHNEKLEILELGAGAGIPTTKALLDHGPNVHVHANDLSSHQLELLKSNLAEYQDRITTLEGDMLSLTPATGTLTAVAGMYCIIHLPRDEQSLLISKIHDWLKPGGLLLANFTEEGAKEVINEKWMGDGGWMYWSGWGAEKTREVIKASGFEILESEVVHDKVDANFLWVLARRKAST